MSNKDREKAIGQFRLQLNGALQPFMRYGLDVHVSEVSEEITRLALLLHRRLQGEQIAIVKEKV